MFNHPGQKLRQMSICVFWIVTITSIGYGLYYIYDNFDKLNRYRVLLQIFVCIIAIPLAQYINTLFLVGFGDLVENSEAVKRKNSNADKKPKAKREKEANYESESHAFDSIQ